MLSTPQLAGEFNGQAIGPDDPEYDRARTVFSGAVDRRPALIVRVADPDDVVRVICYGARQGRGACSPQRRPQPRRARRDRQQDRAQPLRHARTRDRLRAAHGMGRARLTAGEYTVAAGAYGLATGFGDAGSVGIGGITLGGGVGFLVRKYGLTIDDLLAADVVTADGELLRVDADSHPHLFWALRGGGGNFGVVTRLRFRLHDVGTIVGGTLILPAMPDVIASFVAEAQAAPEELSTIANVMTAPPLPFLPPNTTGGRS